MNSFDIEVYYKNYLDQNTRSGKGGLLLFMCTNPAIELTVLLQYHPNKVQNNVLVNLLHDQHGCQ